MCQYWVSDEYNGDGDCWLETAIECEYCKFGAGKLNPFAKEYQRTNANIQQQLQPDSELEPVIPIPVTGKMVFRFGTPRELIKCSVDAY